MSMGKRRALVRAEKGRRKVERYNRSVGESDSDYARKRRGELVPDRNTPAQVWCGVCYRHLSLHDPLGCVRPSIAREWDEADQRGFEESAAA